MKVLLCQKCINGARFAYEIILQCNLLPTEKENALYDSSNCQLTKRLKPVSDGFEIQNSLFLLNVIQCKMCTIGAHFALDLVFLCIFFPTKEENAL